MAAIGGGSGNDVLIGTEDPDTILGRGGDDEIYGKGGADVIDPGTGFTFSAYGDGGDDTIALGASEYGFFTGGEGRDSATFLSTQGHSWALSDEKVEIFTIPNPPTGGGGGGGFRPTLLYTLRQTEVLVGGSGNDRFTPRDVAGLTTGFEVRAGAGDDSMAGGVGVNIFYGEDGNDSIGAYGRDSTYGGAGNDTILASTAALILDGGDGLDRLRIFTRSEVVIIDLAAGSMTSASQVTSLAGFESIETDAATLLGDDAGNTLAAGSYDDLRASFLDGRGGDDILRAGGPGSVAFGRDGDDMLFGDGSSSGSTSQRLDGGAGNDSLFGYSGDDVLVGGTGINRLDGGDGLDRIDLSGASAGQYVDLSFAAQSSAEAYNFLTSIEGAIGSAFDDTLVGTAGDNRLEGGAGSDRIYASAGSDRVAGGTGINSLDGGDGFDFLDYSGLTEAFYLDMRLGSRSTADTYDAFTSFEGAIGGSGSDLIIGTDAQNTLIGGAGDDTLLGLDGDDRLTGGEGIDYLDGGAGIDLVDYDGRTEAMYLDLTNGSFSTATDYDRLDNIEGVIGGEAGDALLGDDGFTILFGAGGDDTLAGRGGDDFLYGGDGADRLIGGTGSDNMFGGAGADIFDLTEGGWDTVADFSLDPFDPDGIYLGYFRSFLTIVERDANGDGVTDSQLTFDGGVFVALGVTGLTLDQWNEMLVT